MATLKNTTINDTGYIRPAVGTTAQRPGTPSAGMIRWNSTDTKMEVYNGTDWKALSQAISLQIPTDNLQLQLEASNVSSYPGSGNIWYDVSGNSRNFTLDSSGIVWNAGGWFDLNDGGGTYTGGAITTTSTGTLALWIQTTDTQSLFWSDDNNQNYIGAYRVGNKEYYNDVGSPTYYQDLVEKPNIYDNIRTGNWIFVEFKNVNFSTSGTNAYFNKYPTYAFSNSKIGAYYIYGKNLTAEESLQLYNATKSTYGL